MTFNKFKEELRQFLEDANVNLGRKNSKTRQNFNKTVMNKIQTYHEQTKQKPSKVQEIEQKDESDRILVLKPKNRRQLLDIGKGVHAMTPSESQRADEQLNRSPYTKNKE